MQNKSPFNTAIFIIFNILLLCATISFIFLMLIGFGSSGDADANTQFLNATYFVLIIVNFIDLIFNIIYLMLFKRQAQVIMTIASTLLLILNVLFICINMTLLILTI